VQQRLRRAFQRWGLPRRLRVDNGQPWGSWSDLPPALALWRIGLGIGVISNDRCCPQQNGVVERSQGTAKRWAEPHACRNPAELQARLDADDRRQRQRYPVARGRSRWELFPERVHSGRAYREEDEAGAWRLERVRDHLAGIAGPRRVDSQGKVSIDNRDLDVGVRYAGRGVWVQFDPGRGAWLINDDAGQELRTQPAPEIGAELIRGLRLAGRK
jgi:hypothetical protein